MSCTCASSLLKGKYLEYIYIFYINVKFAIKKHLSFMLTQEPNLLLYC